MTQEAGLIGRIAIQRGFITRDQLRVATREQARQPDRKLGEVLVALGFIDEAQLGALLAAQRREASKLPRRLTPAPVMQNVPDGVTVGAIALKRVIATRASLVDSAESRRELEARQKEEAARRQGAAEARAWLMGLIVDAATTGASDLMLLPDQPVRLRRFGRWHDFTTGPVNAAGTERLLLEVLSDDARATLQQRGDVCVPIDVPGVGRLRVSVHREERGIGGTFHRAGWAEGGSTLEDLALPSSMASLTNFPRGLLLIAGPSGSGRTTTLKALIQLMSEERNDHILVIESPAELTLAPGESLITQLEVGQHCASVAAAVRDAPGLDVDVICIDELPVDAVDQVLQAAHDDHLVIATVRSLSAVRAVEALVDAFPESERGAACRRVADTLVAVVAQRLVLTRDEGGLALALEVLYPDEAARELIRNDEVVHLHAMVEGGAERGSVSLDEALGALVRSGRITVETARAHARHPANFASPPNARE